MSDDFDRSFTFDATNRYCLGVEEEVWTVHRDTGRLIPASPRVFTPGHEVRHPNLKPELPAQQIEAVTPICRNMREVGAALRANHRLLEELSRRHGFKVNRDPVPRKPFAVNVFPKARYKQIEAKFGARLANAYVAGLHVHVGVGSQSEALRALNVLRAFLPTLLMQSACSPQHVGNTSYASYRFIKYRAMAGPVAPPYLASWKEFRMIAEAGNFAKDPRMCWWSVRISPHGTVETRVMDVQPTLEKTMYLTAAIRMLVRGALLGHLRPQRISAEELEEQLETAAKGKWDLSDLGKTLKPLADDPRYRDEVPFATKLFTPSRRS